MLQQETVSEEFSKEIMCDNESNSETIKDEFEDIKQKLQTEITKNSDLEQEIVELNATLDLYFREAQRRDQLEEEWMEIVTRKLKERIRNLENEIFGKIEEINNLENKVNELQKELNNKDADMFTQDLQIANLQKFLKINRNSWQMGDSQNKDVSKPCGVSHKKEE